MRFLIARVLAGLLLLCPFEESKAEKANYLCEPPTWNAPAESQDGLFTGDLSIRCEFEKAKFFKFNTTHLYESVIQKIRAESIVHEGPSSESPPSTWDVTHHFNEDGNNIQIRELIHVSVPSKEQLKYETHSKEVVASGMAGYLRSVEFYMNISEVENRIQISFRNRVQVKRPWFALDLIFAPIARSICLKKLDLVKEKFMPWILSLNQTK